MSYDHTKENRLEKEIKELKTSLELKIMDYDEAVKLCYSWKQKALKNKDKIAKVEKHFTNLDNLFPLKQRQPQQQVSMTKLKGLLK